MPTCKLCCDKKATKTGSHIFPHSLIKSTINFDGDKNRDKEFLFNFSNISSPSRFQGASVLPERLEDLEIPIDNIQVEDKNPTMEDFIFCPECEQKFSQVESYYAEKIIVPFRTSKIFEVDTKTTLPVKKTDDALIRLYIYGLFWRASISELYDFKMNPDDEDQLGKWLSGSIDDRENFNDFSSLPVAALYMEQLDDTTRAFIDANKFSKRPYMLIIGDFVFFLYMKEKHMKSPINNFYGLGDILKSEKYFNIREAEFKFGKIFRSDREAILRNAIDFLVRENIIYHGDLFSRYHNKIFKVRPTVEDMNQFIDEYRSLGVNVGDEIKLLLLRDNLIRIAKRRIR